MLLDIEGTWCDVSVVDERKIDRVVIVSELNRNKIVVAALQEMKWFGIKWGIALC